MFFRDRSTEKAPPPWRSELMRWAFLGAVAIWIFHPFATSRFYGTGDALWYSNMLADFVLQLRAGVFPVWVGQTEYAFNGAVYPLRVAPMFQHVGGILDLITFHRLTFFELQHAIVIVMGVSGIISCYACLAAILPRQRWAAALLTTLYITCPGVLGLIFVQDLYMSWMTVPFLPLVAYGIVRSYEKDDFPAWLAIAIGLGGCWLGHAPIAMWMTAIAGAAQLIRLLNIHRRRASWKRALLGTAVLVALAQYPFVSVATLHAPGAAGATSGSLENPERIVQALRTAFPGSLRPLSAGAGELSDLQLGYGLFGALLIGGIGCTLKRSWSSAVLLAAAVGVLLLLIPIPSWTEFFWLKLVPEPVRVLTFYWPMHRLYVVLAVTVAFAAAVGLVRVDAQSAITRSAVAALLIGCVWSVWETRNFMDAAHVRTASALDTERKTRPENRLLMTHAYGLFAKLPSYFSHGVLDPNREFRLLDPTTGAPLSNQVSRAQRVSSGTFKISRAANAGVWELSPSFTLVPGQRYDLTFAFADPALRGVLQITGTSFFREYVLPESGERSAFGSASKNRHALSLWTTRDAPEVISLRFIPNGDSPKSTSEFANYEMMPTADGELVSVKRWIPLSLETNRSEASLVLETPRMAINGYRAKVNGNSVPVQSSASLLVDVPVPAGAAQVELSYEAPILLRLSYILNAAAWAGAAACLIYSLLGPGVGPGKLIRSFSTTNGRFVTLV